MIQGGSHLIDHFSSEDCDPRRRIKDGEFFGFFTLHLDDSIRALGCVSSEASLDSLEVFRSPGDLEFRRFDAGWLPPHA